MRLLICCCVVFGGCFDDDGGPSDGEAACLDFADAYADACDRCYPDYPDAYATCYSAFIQMDGIDGDCRNVVAVRDSADFYGACIPSLENAACSQFTDPNWVIDSSCMGQLLYR